jgi:hypothetical protein
MGRKGVNGREREARTCFKCRKKAAGVLINTEDPGTQWPFSHIISLYEPATCMENDDREEEAERNPCLFLPTHQEAEGRECCWNVHVTTGEIKAAWLILSALVLFG